ncbi:MAG: hypothetical protein H7320_22005 [Ferruginibacter sp.]|nr:hypothetical protein [Ferruginibacter sp.]
MKKVLFVLVIAASFTACNNASETPASTSIDSAKKADSMKSATSAMDTAAKKIDSAAVKIDSAAKKIDSATKKM